MSIIPQSMIDMISYENFRHDRGLEDSPEAKVAWGEERRRISEKRTKAFEAMGVRTVE